MIISFFFTVTNVDVIVCYDTILCNSVCVRACEHVLFHAQDTMYMTILIGNIEAKFVCQFVLFCEIISVFA